MSGEGRSEEPAALLDLADNETRMAILRSLANAYSESPADPWVTYADLRAAADVRDKGNFNYHLDRLDALIVKSDEGYRLSVLGMKLVSTVVSRSLDPDWSWGPVPVAGDCARCGESLCLRYEDGVLRLECGTPDHELSLPGTPRLLDTHDIETVTRSVSTILRQEVALVRRGVCPACEGHVEGEFTSAEDGGYHYHGDCRQCGCQYGFAVGLLVAQHPAVVAFLYEHGFDIRDEPVWTFNFCRAGAETVVSTDPLRLKVDIECAEETLSLTLDQRGTVVSVEGPASC